MLNVAARNGRHVTLLVATVGVVVAVSCGIAAIQNLADENVLLQPTLRLNPEKFGSFEFEDADPRVVMDLFRNHNRSVAVLFDADVQGVVSLRLENADWRAVLKAVAQQLQCRIVQQSPTCIRFTYERPDSRHRGLSLHAVNSSR